MGSRDRVRAPSPMAIDGAVPLVQLTSHCVSASNLLGLSVDGASPSILQVSFLSLLYTLHPNLILLNVEEHPPL